MGELVAATVGALVGGFIGYLLRRSEFRRDQRLKIYGEFLQRFSEVVRTGADLQQLHLVLGPVGQVTDPKNRKFYESVLEKHEVHRTQFDEVLPRLLLVASRRVGYEAQQIADWVAVNVHSGPPFEREFSEQASVARSGTGAVRTHAVSLAHHFANVASRDVGGWAIGARRH